MRNIDRDFAAATMEIIAALREAGYTVETPVTGAVIVDGREFSSDEWDRVCASDDVAVALDLPDLDV